MDMFQTSHLNRQSTSTAKALTLNAAGQLEPERAVSDKTELLLTHDSWRMAVTNFIKLVLAHGSPVWSQEALEAYSKFVSEVDRQFDIIAPSIRHLFWPSLLRLDQHQHCAFTNDGSLDPSIFDERKWAEIRALAEGERTAAQMREMNEPRVFFST